VGTGTGGADSDSDPGPNFGRPRLDSMTRDSISYVDDHGPSHDGGCGPSPVTAVRRLGVTGRNHCTTMIIASVLVLVNSS
jgi:hypothetical protein